MARVDSAYASGDHLRWSSYPSDNLFIFITKFVFFLLSQLTFMGPVRGSIVIYPFFALYSRLQSLEHYSVSTIIHHTVVDASEDSCCTINIMPRLGIHKFVVSLMSTLFLWVYWFCNKKVRIIERAFLRSVLEKETINAFVVLKLLAVSFHDVSRNLLRRSV